VLILLFLFAIVWACWSKFTQTPERVTRLCSKEIKIRVMQDEPSHDGRKMHKLFAGLKAPLTEPLA
jgi:hypothetical protein